MLRRKLVLYTLFFIAGITTGFFMFERSRPVEAAGFAASLLLCAVLFGVEEGISFNAGKRSIRNVKLMIALFFAMGFFIFSVRCAVYDSIESSAPDSRTISGKVISAEIKEDNLIMIIRRPGEWPSGVRVNISGYGRDCSETEIIELIGSTIEAVGEYKEIDPADNPGCFDYRLYMRSKGVCVSFKAYSFETSDSGKTLPVKIKRYLYHSREEFLCRFDSDTGSFIRGVIFGEKSEIDEEITEEFNENSTGHILAVSGLHVGFLYGLLRILTGRKRNTMVSAAVIAVIIMYGEMTMWSPATVRACVVMSISLLSLHFRRSFDLLSSISFAALLTLIREPYQLLNAGFQLSFLAMCGISFLTKPISSMTGEALGVTLSVQAGTLPLVAYSFYKFNPLAVFINIPVILLTSALVPFCILMLMCSMIFGSFPKAAVFVIELISDAVIRINHLLNFDGGFSLKAAGFRAAAVVAVYIILFGLSSEWFRVMILRTNPRRALKKCMLIILPFIMIGTCLYDRFADDEIVFLAVGQGDCTHIRAEGHNILIDGGGNDIFNVGERILMPYLLYEGEYKTDMALLTHLHADHYKGIAELSEDYPVGVLGVPADYRGCLEEGSRRFKDKMTMYINPDTRIDITEDVFIESIWPVVICDEPIAADDSNEHNTVYMIHYKGVKVMVTGDLLEEDELQMVEYYEGTDVLKCDVLKVAHHGSKSSSSEAFLDAASPSVAVIQVGRENFYGHPHQQTLERLEKRRIKVCRTDTDGAAGLDIRHGSIYIDLFHAEDRS